MSQNYIRTDLAAELYDKEKETDGIEYSETQTDGITISSLDITNENGAQIMGKPCGKYLTIDIGRIWNSTNDIFEKTASLLASHITEMATSLFGKMPENILAVGLGNRYITPDAIGPLVINNLTVTRHIHFLQPDLLPPECIAKTSAFVPGVLGQTGIETLELVKGAVHNVSPDLVVIIDALAARSTDRLATTVQLTDTGISPGSGIQNKRNEISKHTLGVPVLVIGVPTVVDSSTLVSDALEKAGMGEPTEKLREILENGKSFFVSPKEIDTIIDSISDLVSTALNLSFCGGYQI